MEILKLQLSVSHMKLILSQNLKWRDGGIRFVRFQVHMLRFEYARSLVLKHWEVQFKVLYI